MGSPTTYNGYNVSWTRGKLSGLRKGLPVKGISNYYFSYNAFGQRTNRSYTYSLPTVEPVEVALGMLMRYNQEFCYDHAGRLICERKTKEYYQTPSDSDKIVYLYDADSIIGMVYTENGKTDTYYFQRNVFGDVVGIYDINGTKVGGYAYDAWGNCTITQNTKSVVTRNPIRYRGDYYDQDTKLYYLNTRYYSPEWRRFISPDDTAYLDSETPNGLNLYTYCYNNPVMYIDPSGHFSIGAILVSMAIGSLIGWGLTEIFGSQIAGGIGSIAGGGTAISTGINLMAFGPWGIVAGIALITIGITTTAFGANEIVTGITGINYIQEWTGMSDGLYNGLYIGLNFVASIGSVVGNVGMSFASTAKLNAVMKNPELIQNYSKFQFKTYARYSNQWVLRPSKNGKGMRALSLVNRGNSIRYGYGINNAEHYFGTYYWIVSNGVGKYRFPFP